MVALLTAAHGAGLVAREAVRTGLSRALSRRGDVPLRAADVTPSWLEAALGLSPGVVHSVRVIDEHSGTAARARIAVDADGLPDVLFLKLTPQNYLQHMMMQLFDLGAREVFVYDVLGPELPVRLPRCYAAQLDARRGRNLMVLEDLASSATFQDIRTPATAAQAEAVVDAMATQHAAYWGSTRFSGDLRPLTGRAPATNLLGDVIRKRFIGGMKGVAAGIVPPRMRQQAHIMFERSGEIDAMWAAEPQTVLHGDPHLGNLFFESDTPGFIDWQVAISGAGVRDVAYFATASVDPDVLRKVERGLVERYVAALGERGVDVDLEHQWQLYAAGVTEFFLSAVAAAEAGERAQPPAITRVGVERAVAAAEAHDSFTVLERLVDARRR